MNVIARLEYELAYYDSAVHRFNHYTTSMCEWLPSHVCQHVFVCVFACVCLSVCEYVLVCVGMCVGMFVCLCLYVCVCECLRACIFVNVDYAIKFLMQWMSLEMSNYKKNHAHLKIDLASQYRVPPYLYNSYHNSMNINRWCTI